MSINVSPLAEGSTALVLRHLTDAELNRVMGAYSQTQAEWMASNAGTWVGSGGMAEFFAACTTYNSDFSYTDFAGEIYGPFGVGYMHNDGHTYTFVIDGSDVGEGPTT